MSLRVRRLLAASSLLGAVCSSSLAAASPREWHLDTTVGTDFPVSAGARVGLEIPERIRLSSSFGLMSPFAAAIGGVLVTAGAFDEQANDLVQDSLDTAVVWRNHMGVRPLADHGLFIDAGYGMIVLGGGAQTIDLLTDIGRTRLPSEVLGRAPKAFEVTSTLHMVDVELGWEWTFDGGFKLRGAVGGAFTFDSSTSIESRPSNAPGEVRMAMRRAETRLNELYRTYAFTPVVSVGVGYQFF